jgi:hypothetical protein
MGTALDESQPPPERGLPTHGVFIPLRRTSVDGLEHRLGTSRDTCPSGRSEALSQVEPAFSDRQCRRSAWYDLYRTLKWALEARKRPGFACRAVRLVLDDPGSGHGAEYAVISERKPSVYSYDNACGTSAELTTGKTAEFQRRLWRKVIELCQPIRTAAINGLI